MGGMVGIQMMIYGVCLGNVCREADPNGCSIPDKCTGKSAKCVDNGFYKQDGEPCKYDGVHDSYCYQGK